MSSNLSRNRIREYLQNLNLQKLFINELGWDYGGEDMEVHIATHSFFLKALAQKRGMIAYQCETKSDEAFPTYLTRQKIERTVARAVREHIIVYTTHNEDTQYWQWVKREPGRPDQLHLHTYNKNQSGEALIQKLEHIAFDLDEEHDLTIVDVSGRVRAAFNVETITKHFYNHFKEEHDVFLNFIDGIEILADREWYASLMLNRMMFIYFIQKRRFLDNDSNYLSNRLAHTRQAYGKDQFHTFYRLFLMRLFHEGLSQPVANRPAELSELLGKVPYLNGGLFDVHQLERDNERIHIPDDAFQRIFLFFDKYQWHLDDRPLHRDNEINPDVLGYIFEKYVNQKQMGAYYTKEDTTGYISRNAILPYLFEHVEKQHPDTSKPKSRIWQLLSEDPDRYFYQATRHGITHDVYQNRDFQEELQLPSKITRGLNDVTQRDDWNKPAPNDYALPTETWREHIFRRQNYRKIRAKLVAGEIVSINDLITYNLDIEKFISDVISNSEESEFIEEFWIALNHVSILDPTCGSGAFLFSALSILEPIYVACLNSMRGFLDDQKLSRDTHFSDIENNFRKVIDDIDKHANERYFILKSIIVNNLYGVDIMDEAVEICKLRLFLKLIAQLDHYDQIEPLPDIDFNIRSGNTLVGFVSLDEVERVLTSDLISQLSLEAIQERAQDVDRIFSQFRNIQTNINMNAISLMSMKRDLTIKIDSLRSELNEYMATARGVDISDETVYENWEKNHRPFHWFVEFYGVMEKGGFDIIIGNPPYIKTSKVIKEYSIENLELVKTGNLYSVCVERFLNLLAKNRRYGVIIPISSVSTPTMLPLMHLLTKESVIHISNYAVRPAKLFVGVDMNLSIIVGATDVMADTSRIYTTSYCRWNEAARPYLFECLTYKESFFHKSSSAIAKIGSCFDRSILDKISKHKTLERFRTKHKSNPIYYHSGGRYYRKCLKKKHSNEYKDLYLETGHDAILCLLSSSFYYWYWMMFSDCYHVTRLDVDAVPVPDSLVHDSRFHSLSDMYIRDLERNAQSRIRQRADGRKQREISYSVGKSKNIIDRIDQMLSEHYGLDEHELSYIVDFDAKYRTEENG